MGNFKKIKGTDILIEAFKIYKNRYKGNWKLKCVGNGELKSDMENITNLEFFSFSNEDELIKIASESSVFILPSRNDQWGVVVHEFTALGFPLLISENVGARCTFFIDNYNGLKFGNNSEEELAYKMHLFSKMDTIDIQKMSNNSISISSRISPHSSVANLISVLNDNNTFN